MWRILNLLFLMMPALAAQTVVDVWPPGKMPGKGAGAPEAEVVKNDGFRRLTNVSQPTLTLFPAGGKQGKAAPAVIICPGGGYRYTVVDKEGSEIAAWLNTNGISALVLKYRTPENRDGALQDAQRAIGLTRARSAEWGIDSGKIGLMGFSAGGHLAARCCTLGGDRTYAPVDGSDLPSCRPDFALLVYPAYLDGKDGRVPPDLKPGAGFPPALMIHSEDDRIHVTGSRAYHDALKGAGIAHAFKLYATGGHGYGLHCRQEAKAWPADALAWLRQSAGIGGE